MNGTELEVSRKNGVVSVINVTESGTDDVYHALKQEGLTQVADVLGQWVSTTHTSRYSSRKRRLGGLWDRDRWLAPQTTFDKIRLAREALSDDVVGGAADGTEALALSAMSIYAEDEDEQDVWNQIAADVNLDEHLRQMWRILYTDSQCVFGVWWDRKTYKVRGATDAGNARRKKFDDMLVPVGMTTFDTTKVTPIGQTMFGGGGLAYVADSVEQIVFDQILAKRDGVAAPKPKRSLFGFGWRRAEAAALADVPLDDEIVRTMVLGRYYPDYLERRLLEADGVDCTNLFRLNPQYVFRHTLTKGAFQRFAEVRLESLFPLLDLKAQLQQMDRAHLVGGTHFIVLITKGTDQLPAQEPEIAALQRNAYSLASVPVIVGDHRLKVEIITPKLDSTLSRAKYDTINMALFARAWNTFVPTGGDTDDPTKLARVIGKNLEGRRLMMRRTLEATVIDMTRKMNAARLTSRAKIVFHPATISLTFDAAWASFLIDLRAANEISRETLLTQFDLDQSDEAAYREREARKYDHVFNTLNPNGPQPTQGQPAGPAAQKRAGRRQNKGAGAAPGSGQGQPARNPRRRANGAGPVPRGKETAAVAELRATLDQELVAYLRDAARDLDIRGRSGMGKADLIDAIVDARQVRDGLQTDLEDERVDLTAPEEDIEVEDELDEGDDA